MGTIIITGVNGFVGKHLTRELVNEGHSVIGVGREEMADPEIVGRLKQYIFQDIAVNWPAIDEPLESIINLAGLAAIGPSFESPQRYLDINSAIVTNMAEHYLKRDQKPRLLLISSGAIYDAHQPMPLTEDSHSGYGSPYVVSKLVNETQAEYYRRRGLDIVVARPFNHIGPGQGPGFLVADLIAQIKAFRETGSPLSVGNLKTRRDYTDVRDVAKAYRLLATTPTLHHEVYNVCTGKNHVGEEILATLQKLTNTQDAVVEVDQSKIRPNDPIDHLGSAERLKQDTSWEPTISLEQTLRDSVSG